MIVTDYRNTLLCISLNNILARKQEKLTTTRLTVLFYSLYVYYIDRFVSFIFSSK